MIEIKKSCIRKGMQDSCITHRPEGWNDTIGIFQEPFGTFGYGNLVTMKSSKDTFVPSTSSPLQANNPTYPDE